MKNVKNAREDFWLELGPAAAYAGMDAEQAARENGDASPDGKACGFTGAEQGTIYEPSCAQACGCGCGKEEDEGCGCVRPDGPDHNQTSDGNTDTLPPEVPPIPPETWPGL